VPAEVLALHALALSLWTRTAEGADGATSTAITDPTALRIVFVVLLGVAVVIYWLTKRDSFDRLDLARMLLPAAAFVLWTAATPGSAFDAVAPGLETAARTFSALLAAALLVLVAQRLADDARAASGGTGRSAARS
jgi:hypothetical protein